ncbi:MAG: cell division protein FtsW, partial [Acidobacteriota bacterium]|nr:cell division protein FtsW [Acidobacteriota bacterium]
MAKKLAFDKVLFTTIMLLVGAGLVMVYSASAGIARGAHGPHGLMNPFLLKQGIWATIGLGAMALVMHVDYRRLQQPAVVYSLLCGILVLLVGVLFSPELNGTRRWFFLAGLSLQPSELAKIALVPFLAYQIDRKLDRVNHPDLLLPLALFTGLTAGLILLEPDMGTAVL